MTDAGAPATTTTTRPADVVVTVERLVVGYRGRGILPPIDLVVRRGELWALVGRNGGGKTTFLRTLLGLLPKVAGERRVAPGAAIGYVPQRVETDPAVPARVVDVVRGGVDQGWSFLDPRASRRAAGRVAKAMSDTQTTELAEAQLAALSEGQRQRVHLARALVVDPALLVLDEPTSAMDARAERDAFDLLVRVQRERALAVVVVSHHLSHLATRATHVLYVDAQPSGADGVVRAGPVDEMRDLLAPGAVE